MPCMSHQSAPVCNDGNFPLPSHPHANAHATCGQLAAANPDVRIVPEAVQAFASSIQPEAVKAASRPAHFPIRFPSQEAEWVAKARPCMCLCPHLPPDSLIACLAHQVIFEHLRRHGLGCAVHVPIAK
eukprot:1148982-Pelagomonas_calceolata.AAC.1